jgi:TldD protein
MEARAIVEPTADPFDIATEVLLAPSDLDIEDLDRALQQLMATRPDFGDVYLQDSCYESWTLDDGIVRAGTYSADRGLGVRAIEGERTGFAYADGISLAGLSETVGMARSIVRAGSDETIKMRQRPVTRALYSDASPLVSLADDAKIQVLLKVDQMARAKDPRVEQVVAEMVAVHETILVVASDGTWAADVRPLVRINVSVILVSNGRREQGYAGAGGRTDYPTLLVDETLTSLVSEAVRQADVNLEAVAAPAGAMPVVLGPGWPGVLLHEAIGHGLEGDFNRKGTSAFSGRLGEQVASSVCTVVDDGTLAGRRGSLTVDDEGQPSQCTTLIEGGKLASYIQDKLNAGLMGAKLTGNGRRESFAHLPLPRMTNTYMLPGESDPEEILASVERGLYAPNFGGGQVDITSGKFVFSASEAYLVENGKLTVPVKGAMLIGNGPDVLTRVSMVGNDLQLDPGIGVCGKDGQSVPVGVGQPTLKIDSLTVGGTEA